MEITFPLALLGGLLSFFSPCFLPIVPAFAGQLLGGEVSRTSVRTAVINALCFILGFTVVFVGMWATVSILGSLLGRYSAWFRLICGVVLILMGLHVARIINIAPLNWMWRVKLRSDSPQTSESASSNPLGRALRSALMGVVFAAGWTPCIGPILGGILALATVSQTFAEGIILMLVYCLGLGLPILGVAVGAAQAQARFGWFKRHHVLVSMVSGVFLVSIGVMMVTNLFGKLAAILPSWG